MMGSAKNSSPRISEFSDDRRFSEFSTSGDSTTPLLNRKTSFAFEAPCGPALRSVGQRGPIERKCSVWNAKFSQWWFKTAYGVLKAPFQNARTVTDFDQILTLIAFCFVNLLPVHIFSLVVFADYTILVEVMGVATREMWTKALWYITWFFVFCYGANVARLVITLILENHHIWWFDWEEIVYNWSRPKVISLFKAATDTVWENFHLKTWKFIRRIQSDSSASKQAIQEACAERGLPQLVEACLVDFAVLKGAKELDYRWYLHDNRKKSPHLKKLKYEEREVIASFLIPQDAFEMSKDDIVDMFCE